MDGCTLTSELLREEVDAPDISKDVVGIGTVAVWRL